MKKFFTLFLSAMVSLWVAAEEEKPQRVYWDIADQPEIVFHPDYRRAGASVTFYNGDLCRMRWDDSQNRGITYYCGGFPEENGDYDVKSQYVYGDQLTMRLCTTYMKYLEIKTPRLVKGDYNVWICWRRANPCQFTTTFKQEGYEDQVFEPNVDLQDYMGNFDGNTDKAVANGWKQYNAKAYNSVFCSRNIATISVKETGEHILRFDATIQSKGDGDYWDMIQFIPVDEDQTWPRVAMDGTLIEKDVPADAIYPSDGTYLNENNVSVNWWDTHERTYLTPQVELMDFKDSLFSYKSVKGEPFVRIVDYIADSSVLLDELTIPATVTYEGEEYSVAGFYDGKLGGTLNVKKLIIEEGEITHIPSALFMGCSFTEIVMNGITSIEESGFYDCTSLTTVTAPKLYQIGDYGFGGCKALTTLNVGKSIVLGEAALGECESLTEIPTIDGIATKALYNCFSLKSIRFSPLVDDALPRAIFKAIPKQLSDESYSLVDVYVENPMIDLKNLPKNNTVQNYFNATVHVTPTAVAYVKGTLSDHIGSSVVDVVADETIPAIGWRYTCEEGKAKITGYRSWLTDIVVPETLNDRLTGEPLPTDLATTQAFRVTVANESTRDTIYRNMTSFTMSDCMTVCPTLEARLDNFHVGAAFDGTGYLGGMVPNTKNFVVSESNPYLCAVDGKVYSKDKTTLIAWIKGEELENLPASVTKLSTWSLYQYACDKLIIPEGVKEIELSAVSNGKMKLLYLPSTLTTVSDMSFRGNTEATDSLRTVYCANPLPIAHCGGIYVGNTDGGEVERIDTLYVRPESVEAYKADGAWAAKFVNILPYDGFAPSAIEEQLADKRVASPQFDGSGISGLEPGSIVTIYNVAGVQVKQDVVPADGRIEFVEGGEGLYLIRHAGKVYKWMKR